MTTRWTTVGTLALALLVSGLLANREATAKDAKKDVEAKEMKFRYVSLTIAGKETPKEDLKGLVLVVKGDLGTVYKDGKKLMSAKAKIDMDKKPWTIDLTETEGKDKGKTMMGIMDMKDGQMRVCMGKEGGARPTEFTSTAENGQILEVLEELKGKE
jgi:uncharacterized protein (TIGR03067 family)